MRADHRYSDRGLVEQSLIDGLTALAWLGFFVLLCLSVGMPIILLALGLI